MSQESKTRMYDLENRLYSMRGQIYRTEIATIFNSTLKDEFEKANLKPVFVGQYFIDPKDNEKVRVLCHQGTDACSPIPTERGGVIWRAIRTGVDQYVKDVTKDREHVGCDPNMQGSELVLLSWSDPYKNIELGGHSVPLGVLDIDLNIKDALSMEEIERLRKLWDVYGKKVFPGEPEFLPGKFISISKYIQVSHRINVA